MNYVKRLLFFFILILCTVNIYSQSNFKAVYNYVDTGDYTNTEYNLYYKNGVSKYFIYKEKEIRKIKNFQFDISFVHLECYYDLSKNICSQYRILSDEKTPIVSEWENVISWKILDETKKIGKYTVQKATSNYLLEDFPDYGYVIAWFTTEIPISTGPSRNTGLPGLVIQVEYTNAKPKITLKSIEFKDQEDIIINTKGIKVSKDEMIKPWTINKKWLRIQKKEFDKRND